MERNHSHGDMFDETFIFELPRILAKIAGDPSLGAAILACHAMTSPNEAFGFWHDFVVQLNLLQQNPDDFEIIVSQTAALFSTNANDELLNSFDVLMGAIIYMQTQKD